MTAESDRRTLQEQYGDEYLVYHEHPTWGELMGNCNRCGGPLYRKPHGRMCPDCIRETAGTDECPICEEHGERVCGYHATCIWYCPDCGHVRRIGNQPVRPDQDVTNSCCVSLHPEDAPFDLPRMVRLCYESVMPPQLRDYYEKRSEAWNEASREWQRRHRAGVA